jgi:DNA-binding NtrC family response regulator
MHFLVADDDDVLRTTVRHILEREGHTTVEAEDGEEALLRVSRGERFDGIILDVNMPRMNGIVALEKIKELAPSVFCLIMTAYSNVQDAVQAIKVGAFDYIEKPVDRERLMDLVERACSAKAMVEQASFSAPKLEFDHGRSIIGGSSQILKVFDVIHRLAKVDTSVLIRGESGTGKELVARAIHFNSNRMKGPFVAVNCAAIPENLIESELFGHEKGSFTGADKRKIGKFQFAEGGTIFLDEIGDISLQMQVKLLRVLQERQFTPVGGNQELKCHVRVVAATNRPLEKMITDGTYRSDLFYRLNVMPITLPPLRERREDIAALVAFMVKKFNGIHSRSITSVDGRALALLAAYDWPGNIRELENVVEHAFILEPSNTIGCDALPNHIQTLNGAAAEISAAPMDLGDISESDLNYPVLKEKFEKEFLLKALKTYNGRINQTAEHTQMTKVTLLRKLEKYGIDPRAFHN